nr:ionotropic receptor 21a [Tropidothorax elegans]
MAFYLSLGNPVLQKYIREEVKDYDCHQVIPGLVTTIVNDYFTTNLTVLIIDGNYFLDISFKRTLSKILEGLKYSSVMFGRKNNEFLQPRGNERPSYVVFSSQLEAFPGKTLLISHNSPFQVKKWLTSTLARKYMDIVAISDPAILKSNGEKNDCEVGLYTHSLNDESFGGAKAIIVSAWRKNNFTRKPILFPNKYISGYKGVHLKVAIEEQPPYTFKRLNNQNELVWDGVEVKIINHLAMMLNFTYEFMEAKTHLNPRSVLELVKKKDADIGIGRQVATSPLLKLVTLSYPHSQDCAAFISLASTALPKYRAIMGPFLWDVWVALTATYIFAVVPIAFSAWHTLRPLVDNPAVIEDMFWYVFGTFTNLFTFVGEKSWTKGAKCSTKLFIGTYWVFSIIVTACYTGSIIAFITLPVYPEVVDTMHQLLHKNYQIITLEKDGWWNLLISSYDDEASGLAGTATTVDDYNEGIAKVIKSSKVDQPYALFASKEHLNYIIKINFTNSKVGKRQMFHITKQCFVTQMVSIILEPDSLYTETLNNAVLRASEFGFITKIYNDIEWNMYKSSIRSSHEGDWNFERELTLDDTQGMFLLLGIGFGLAACAWVLELGTWAKGRDLGALGKERILSVSRRFSRAFLGPTDSHLRQHYPLYFRSDVRRRSSLFGSRVESTTAFSQIHLKPPDTIEKPIRLLSF